MDQAIVFYGALLFYGNVLLGKTLIHSIEQFHVKVTQNNRKERSFAYALHACIIAMYLTTVQDNIIS